jgi:hypothetical protein
MKRMLAALLIILVLPNLAMAQSTGKVASQKLVLEFVDGSELTVTRADKSVVKLGSGIFEGDEVPVGSIIATGPSTRIELKLKPNGTIIRIAKSTTFKIVGLASSSSTKNAFSLTVGKVRAVAAKGAEYEMTSRSAACSVRGTDFSFAVDSGKAQLMVAKGLVQFDKLDDSGKSLGSIPVAAGEAADAFSQNFAAFAYSAEQYAEQYSDLSFAKLLESDVPDKAIDTEETTVATNVAPTNVAPTNVAPTNVAPPEASPSVQAAPSSSAAAPATPPTTVQATPPTKAPAIQKVSPEAAPKEEPKAEPKAAPLAALPESAFAKWLRDSMGFAVGSIMIDGENYSKVLIQPNIVLGRAKLGLYLPVIYTSDLFKPEEWYRPKGNNEWDFGYEGFSKGDALAGAEDLATDLALKIKYFEFGEQFKDPFFVKVGNLDDLTLGHGLIMRSYANDTDFPSVRRLGFDTGLDLSKFGFEFLADDLTDPGILGSRVYVRPFTGFKLAIGASAAIDLNPASGDATLEATDGGLKLLGSGLDLDLPIVQNPAFGLRLFADGAVTLPITTSAVASGSGGSISPGLQTQLIYDGDTHELKNWGASTGLLGNILFMDWRLEYRYSTGFFRPSIFDSTYNRMRSYYAAQYLGYLRDQSSYSSLPDLMGVYGEGSFKLFKDKLSLTLGYYWPWSLEAGTDMQKQLVRSSDELHARLDIKKGLVPLVDIAGAVFYDKRGLAQSIADQKISILDSDTAFGGEIDIPLPKTPNLDIAVVFATVPVFTNGKLQYVDEAKGLVELKPSIGLEVRFHF